MADKIVIRINNPRPIKPDPSAPPAQVVVYHWHRIGAALLVVAVVIGAIVAGLRHDRQPPSPAAGLPSSTPATTGKAADTEQPHSAEADRTMAEPHEGPKASSPPGSAAADPISPRRDGLDSTASAVAKPAPAAALPGQPPRSVAATPSPAASGSLIRSPAIRRIQLTSEVHDGAPVDEIRGIIPMNAKGLVKVFLYMETEGLKGRVLFHDWYWKDKRIAHARVPLRHTPQNAATSKYIDRIMTGPWRVVVVDERNTVYAETRFEVR
jgi:hypothetical protein